MKAQYQTFITNPEQQSNSTNTFGNIIALQGLCERETVRHLQAVVHDYFPQVVHRSALDLSAGRGVTAMALAELGFSVAAFDMYRNSVSILQRIALQQDLNIAFEMGGILQVEKLQMKFDLIHEADCLTNIPLSPDRQAFLESIRNSLKVGGKFVMSTSVLTDSYDASESFESVRLDENHILWRQTPESDALGVIAMDGKFWTAQKRLATAQEIRNEMMAAGFEIMEEELTVNSGNGPGTLRMVLASTTQC